MSRPANTELGPIFQQVINLETSNQRCLKVVDGILIQSTGVPIPKLEQPATDGSRSHFYPTDKHLLRYGDVLLKLSVDRGKVALRFTGWNKPFCESDDSGTIDFGEVGVPLLPIGGCWIRTTEADCNITATYGYLPTEDRKLLCETTDADNDNGYHFHIHGKTLGVTGMRDPGFSHNTFYLIDEAGM